MKPRQLIPFTASRHLLIVTIALMLSAASAGAQVLIGGHIGLGTRADGNGLSLSLYPDISYRLNNNFIVGGQLSFRTSYNQLGVNPYLRCHLRPFGTDLITVFLSANMPCEFTGNSSSISLRLRPGFTVRISENFYLVANVGYTGYSWTFNGSRLISSKWSSRFNQDSINIGFCVAL